MTTDHKIRDEKLQYDINREAEKISALSSGKIEKYEYLTGEEILPPDQRRMIEQLNFIYSPLGKAFEKQAKTVEDQEEKQIKAIEENKKRVYNKQQGNNKLLLSREREIKYREIKDSIKQMNYLKQLIMVI